MESRASAVVMQDGKSTRSRQGEAALAAVTRGILERVERCGTLRVETIPAMWPMTRHLVRRMSDRLVEQGILRRLADGSVALAAVRPELVADWPERTADERAVPRRRAVG